MRQHAVIELGEELAAIDSFSQWLAKGDVIYEKAYKKAGCKQVVSLDSSSPRRIVTHGAHFKRASQEGTYPVVVYSLVTDTQAAQ